MEMVTPLLSVHLVRSRRYAVVRPTGELDLAGHAALCLAISRAEQASPSVVVDLSTLDFMDSSSLRLLSAAHERALARARGFHLIAGRPSVQAVFRLTGTETRFRWISPEQLA
jgi:anti-anti-sigma factor